MIKVEQTKNIITGTTDNPVEYLVENLPADLQQVIIMLDDWREREANLQSEMNMVATAINAAKNTLLQGITSMEAAAAEAAATATNADFVEVPAPEAKAE